MAKTRLIKGFFTALLFIAALLPALPQPALSGQPAYFRLVLLADCHLPVRSREVPEAARQQKIIRAKEKVVADINAWDDVAGVVVLGDIAAEVGNDQEYAFAKEFFAKLKKPAYFIAGNHDYLYSDGRSAGGKLTRGDERSKKEKLQRFSDTFSSELYYSRRIGRYLLVFLSADALDSPHLCQMSEQQLAWLRRELAENLSAPTIVFFHAPLAGTLADYNTKVNKPAYIAQPAAAVREIIAGNPQVFLWVSGHTHTPATNASFAGAVNIYHGRVTNIHNADLDRETIWTNSLYLYPDKVIVKTFDHKARVWLGHLERRIPVPE